MRKIVCLCGSTRFKDAFTKAQLKETLAGRIVLTIGCNMKSDSEIFGHMTEAEREAIKAKLDILHLEKIKLADEVLILNVGGYIGESTARELAYAKGLGKLIRFLEYEKQPTPEPRYGGFHLDERLRPVPNVPEPPKAETCVCRHDKKEHWTFGVCQVSECGCMGYESQSNPEPPKAWPVEYSAIGAAIDKLDKEGHLEPEASQQAASLPAGVTGTLMACWGDLQRAFRDSSVSGMEKAWRKLHQRLAALWPKAGQPDALPAKVEAMVEDLEAAWRGSVGLGLKSDRYNTAEIALGNFRRRLAALWPKAEQAPSGITEQDIKNLQALAICVDHPWDETAETGAWRDLFKSIMELKLVQPSPVTDAEQLMVQLAGCSTAALGFTKEPAKQGDYGWSPAYQDVLDLRRKYDALQSPVTAEKLATFLTDKWDFEDDASEAAESILAAFPTLGQGRLTREQIVERIAPIICKREHLPVDGGSPLPGCEVAKLTANEVADDLLALQGQAKVSRAEIQTAIKDIHVMPLARAVEQALKNLGMEVSDD